MVTQVAFSTLQRVLAEHGPSRPVNRDGDGIAAHAAIPAGRTATSAAATTSAPPPVDERELESAVSEINRQAQNKQRALQFSIDEASGDTIITVLDKETREVIRRIPPDEVLTLAERYGYGAGALLKLEA